MHCALCVVVSNSSHSCGSMYSYSYCKMLLNFRTVAHYAAEVQI